VEPQASASYAVGVPGGVTQPVPPPPAAPVQAPGGYAMVWSPAPVWRRAAAAALNTLIVVVGGGFFLGFVGSLLRSGGLGGGEQSRLVYAAIIQALTVGGVLAYFGRGWSQGATPGMRALRLSIVDRGSGDLPRTDQVLLRMAGGVWGIVLLPVALLWCCFSAQRRGWHDQLAGTIVVSGEIRPWWWSWNGERWEPSGAPAAPAAVPQPTGRRAAPTRPDRSRWTWTDVLPIVVLQLPVALVGQLAVVRATRAIGLGRPSPSLGSLILDVVAYGLILAMIWLFLGLRRKVSLAEIGFRPVPWRWVAAALPALVVAYAAEVILGELGNAALPPSAPTQCHDIQQAYGGSVALALLGVAVVAPLVEETLFRGVVFGWMRGRMPLGLAVVGSAAVFAAAHVLYLQWTLLPPIFGIGCVLALLYHYSRSLWPGIVVHASINTIATLALLLGAVHC